MKSIASLAGLFLAISGAVQADDCEYHKQLELSLEAGRELAIDVGAGSLEVRGVPGANRITATGQACASSQRQLDQLELVQRGDRIEAVYPDSGWSLGKRYARIDLHVEVPADVLVDIDDGSGSIEVDGLAGVRIDDGSGSILVRNVRGDVRIEDGSGSITVRDIAGTLFLDDGSGEIDVDGVERDVLIDEDGSGSIEIANVIGNVEIEEDGSGSIRIREVVGSVRIDRDGSGSISVKSVAGNFEVGDAGSGGIDFAGIDGEVILPRDSRRLK